MTAAPILGSAFWYATRGAGVISLLALTASLALGIVTSLGWSGRHAPKFVTAALHRNISFLALALIAVHVTTTIVDGYVPVGWISAIIPFTSGYHPLTVGLGAIALDVTLAVMATSMFRAKLSHDTWRLVHWCAYLCWPIALLHGFLLGTDRTSQWFLVLDAICLVFVTVLVAFRTGKRSAPNATHRTQSSRSSLQGHLP